MHLTNREIEKLMLFTAGEVARKRKNRDIKINRPEFIAYISSDFAKICIKNNAQ